jgi:ribosomal protein L29
MKITQIKKELSELTFEQLLTQKNEIAKKLFEIKMQVRLGKMRDTALIRKLRKVIARINTCISAQSNQLSL